MVDLHIHAPQYAFRGMCMDLELMDWLNQYALPEEEKYEDLEYANKAYNIFVEAIKKVQLLELVYLLHVIDMQQNY